MTTYAKQIALDAGAAECAEESRARWRGHFVRVFLATLALHGGKAIASTLSGVHATFGLSGLVAMLLVVATVVLVAIRAAGRLPTRLIVVPVCGLYAFGSIASGVQLLLRHDDLNGWLSLVVGAGFASCVVLAVMTLRRAPLRAAGRAPRVPAVAEPLPE